MLIGSTAAAEGDTLTLSVFGAHRYDSNLFRLPVGAQLGENGSRSATTTTAGLGLRVDKRYSLQRLTVDASVINYRYDPYQNLNFTGQTVSSIYAWNIATWLAGNLIYNVRKTPSYFGDVGLQLQPNPLRTEERRLDVDLLPISRIHPRLSIFEIQQSSARPTFQLENFTSDSVQFSLLYNIRPGDIFELYGRSAKGSQSDLGNSSQVQVAPKFTEREWGLRTNWQATGRTKLELGIGVLDRKHPTFPQRDFNGTVGRFSYLYSLTGKTELSLSGSRSLRSSQTAISSFYTEDVLQIAPIWSVTGKIFVRPSYTWRDRTFRGSIDPLQEQQLYINSHTTNIQVDWAALRSVAVSFSVFDENQRSTISDFRFRNRGFLVSARMQF